MSQFLGVYQSGEGNTNMKQCIAEYVKSKHWISEEKDQKQSI